MVGKAEIATFLNNVTEQLKGWRMEATELDFRRIEVSGDGASEWAFEHQVVQPPGPHQAGVRWTRKEAARARSRSGWKQEIKRKMWNQGEKAGPR
jgi:hypothetical protein